jgi:hypothetical protein
MSKWRYSVPPTPETEVYVMFLIAKMLQIISTCFVGFRGFSIDEGGGWVDK